VRRLLLLVGAVIFVDTMFFAALTPLLPTYAEDLDLSKAGVGILAAAYPAGAFAGGIPGGISAARFGVKPTVVTGLLLMVVTTTAFGFA
jgi:MFS family permease